MSADSETKSIGIGLSGGGCRAAIFGLGVLLYLADSGANRRVSAISSVSGGSMLNGFIALQDKPFNGCTGDDFEVRAARFAQLIAGDRARWILMTQLMVGLLIVLILAWAIIATTALTLCLAAVLLTLTGLVFGRRCGGPLLGHGPVWLYVATLIWSALAIAAWLVERRPIIAQIHQSSFVAALIDRFGIAADGLIWAASLVALSLAFWALAQQRHAVAGMAYGHALARLQGTRGGPRAPLDEMNRGDIRHVFCATELHAGQHAFFCHDLVYCRGFGIGGPNRLPVSTAIQLSANFPGGFPPRILKSSRFRFELTEAPMPATLEVLEPMHPVPRWLVLSDGGVFDNTADSWFLDVKDRLERTTVEFNKLLGSALEDWEEEDPTRKRLLNYDEATWTPEFREPFNSKHRILIDRLRAMEQMPNYLIVVNGGRPEPWQSLWSVWIPLIGELTGFGKISSTMYNNGTSARLRDLGARLHSRPKEDTDSKEWPSIPREGAIIDIMDDPLNLKIEEEYLRTLPISDERNKRPGVVYDYFKQGWEDPQNLGIGQELTAELKKLQLLPQLSTAVPTTLAPLGFEVTAELLYHGYMQAMATLHLSQGSPLLEPRPTLDDFVDLAHGRPRKRRPPVR
jgi:predicted acylesterase/phospholipase RssA